MTTAELNALISRHGGLAGTPVPTNPTIDNPNKKYSTDPDKIPNPNPDYKYTFQDGTDITLRASATDDPDSPTGFDTKNLQVVDAGTALKPASDTSEAANPQLAAQRKAEADAAAALAAQRKAEDDQRAKNKAATGYGVTDAELAKIRSDATSQNLTQAQIDQRAHELEVTSTAKNRELDIAAANNKIAAANQALNDKRLQLDETVRQDASKLDWAKFEYLKAKDVTDAQIANAKLDLDRLQQQQTGETQKGQLAVQQATAAEAARHNLAAEAQAAATAQAQAEQTATTAAGTLLTNERQAQAQAAQTGAGLLQQRAASAQGLLTNILDAGTRRPLYAGVPSGIGEQLVSGITGWTRDLMGGQGTLDAAANMIRAANPGQAQSPTAAAATAALTQMMQKYQAANGGQPHPIELAHQSSQLPTSTGGTNMPQPNPAIAAANQPNQFGFNPQASTAALQAAGFSDTPEGRAAAIAAGQGSLLGAQPGQQFIAPFTQSGLPEGRGAGYVAPSLPVQPPRPTVTINVGG